MSIENLKTYLRDHQAGATAATEIIERLIIENQGEPMGDFSSELLVRIEQDEKELQTLMKNLNAMPGVFKTLTASMIAKFTKLKLGRAAGRLGTFQALEMLSIGILGKKALWTILQQVQHQDEILAALEVLGSGFRLTSSDD